ncbi:MAG: hypothetical protein NTX66_00470 [Candidatus Falkowbacteria bacterium]|nr:hypothetical protein [Candidatus Falkowbacteria bacterium]
MKFTNKTLIYLVTPGFLLLGLFLALPAQALSPLIRQVKTPDSPSVYYLNHATQLKKAYINEAAYLGYGNKWSEVKLISDEELAKWSDVLLVKTEASSDIYYIKGTQKALIASGSDLINLGLVKEPILIISQTDLDQYTLASDADLGLVLSSNSINPNNTTVATSPSLASSTLNISFTETNNATNNNILAGTNSNLIGVLNLQAGQNEVAIRTLKVDVTGIYNSDLIDKVYLTLEDYKMVDRYSHFTNRQLEVNFPNEPYLIPAGGTRTIRIWVNLKTCTFACANQTIRTEIKEPSNIVSNASVAGVFPLTSNYFKILSVPNLLGQPLLQELALETNPSGQNLILGKFTLAETSGNEDIYLKELTLVNDGSANFRDLKTFRLQIGDNIISRAPLMTSGNKIVFKVNYCRIGQDSPVTLTVFGQKSDDFASGSTLNLEVESAWIVGKNLNVSLTPTVNNLDEVKVIN